MTFLSLFMGIIVFLLAKIAPKTDTIIATIAPMIDIYNSIYTYIIYAF